MLSRNRGVRSPLRVISCFKEVLGFIKLVSTKLFFGGYLLLNLLQDRERGLVARLFEFWGLEMFNFFLTRECLAHCQHVVGVELDCR